MWHITFISLALKVFFVARCFYHERITLAKCRCTIQISCFTRSMDYLERHVECMLPLCSAPGSNEYLLSWMHVANIYVEEPLVVSSYTSLQLTYSDLKLLVLYTWEVITADLIDFPSSTSLFFSTHYLTHYLQEAAIE